MSGDDPYAPPAESGGAGEAVTGKAALREIVLSWEKLRLAYNLALLVPGIVILVILIRRQGMPVGFGVAGALAIAVAANLAFMLGPLAELYFRGIFRNGESIGRGRWLIFGAGLVVSGGVFVAALLVALA